MVITIMNAMTPTLDGFGCGRIASWDPVVAIGGEDVADGGTCGFTMCGYGGGSMGERGGSYEGAFAGDAF